MEMHEDAVSKGERVILVDDLIATAGTAEGAVKLWRQMGAECARGVLVIDLAGTRAGRKLRARDVPVRTLISFEGRRRRRNQSSGSGARTEYRFRRRPPFDGNFIRAR